MKGELARTVGRNVRAYRKERGLTQEQLSFEWNCHRTWVGKLERGEENLSLLSIEDLAERLALDPQQLLFGTPSR